MELQEALQQISVIRDAAARTETFRGYRSAMAGFSAMLGILAAIGQAVWLPQPWNYVDAYLYLWCGVAAVSIAVAGVSLAWHARQGASELATRQTCRAVEQFLPCLVAGALLTHVIAENAIDCAWMLPGLWSMLFSLGMFASLRFLPRPMILVAVHYLACGVLCLCLAIGEHTLSPWSMGLTFGGGQALAAAILYFTLERNHGET